MATRGVADLEEDKSCVMATATPACETDRTQSLNLANAPWRLHTWSA